MALPLPRQPTAQSLMANFFREESWRPVESDRQATTQFKKDAGPEDPDALGGVKVRLLASTVTMETAGHTEFRLPKCSKVSMLFS